MEYLKYPLARRMISDIGYLRDSLTSPRTLARLSYLMWRVALSFLSTPIL